jgi:hypothetical protein
MEDSTPHINYATVAQIKEYWIPDALVKPAIRADH